MFGIERLMMELRELGYTVERAVAGDGTEFAVIRDYFVELGRFAGRTIGLGLQGTADYPRTVPAAIHVRDEPQLLPDGSVPNVRNVQPSALGAEWRYWSHNFNWTGERHARRLMSQINRIFKDA